MNQAALKELLAFYDAAGVDSALGDAPVNRFAPPAPAPKLEPAPAQPTPTGEPAPQPMKAPPPNPDQADQPHQGIADAEALAAAAPDLNALRQALQDFDGCGLKKTARQLVFADGNPRAKIMLVGEAPGRDEDAQGLPFVGRSGQLLDRMLAAIGLDRSKVYISNVIYWRPPANRTPTADERAMCEPFVRRQIELVQPKVMMSLGGSALTALFGQQGIMKTRGQAQTYSHNGLEIPAIPTLHPAALLRNPANKRLVWQDLLTFQEMVEEHGAL